VQCSALWYFGGAGGSGVSMSVDIDRPRTLWCSATRHLSVALIARSISTK